MIRYRFNHRRADGHRASGFINADRIDDAPHWEGNRAGGFAEVIFKLPSGWALLRRALEPQLASYSDDETTMPRERVYVDESSTVAQLADDEARRWFDRAGLDVPPELAALVGGGKPDCRAWSAPMQKKQIAALLRVNVRQLNAMPGRYHVEALNRKLHRLRLDNLTDSEREAFASA